MQIVNARTGEAIPFASVIAYGNNGNQLAGTQADSNGNVNTGFLAALSIAGYTTVSAAGYQTEQLNTTEILSSNQIALREGVALDEVVITASRKIRENPGTFLIILAVLILAYSYRKQIF